MKVALYHGKTVQNSALALYEQIELIKLILELKKTEELKVSVALLFSIIKEIHQNDFNSIKSSDNNTIILCNPQGLFDLDQYELDIKAKIMNLPRINQNFTNALILVEKSLDCKLQYLKNGTNDNFDTIEATIDKYLEQVSEGL